MEDLGPQTLVLLHLQLPSMQRQAEQKPAEYHGLGQMGHKESITVLHAGECAGIFVGASCYLPVPLLVSNK